MHSYPTKQLDHPNFAIWSIMAHHTVLLKMQPNGKINISAPALPMGIPFPNPGAKPEVSSFAFSARPVFLTLEEGIAYTPAWSPGSRCCRCTSALIHRRLPPTCNFSSSPPPTPHPAPGWQADALQQVRSLTISHSSIECHQSSSQNSVPQPNSESPSSF